MSRCTVRDYPPYLHCTHCTHTQCVLTLRECDNIAVEAIGSTFCYCCWNNQSFSACALEDLQVSMLASCWLVTYFILSSAYTGQLNFSNHQVQISLVLSSELKAYFKVLTAILLIEDSLQPKRISFTINGGKYQPHVSIFTTIRNNSANQNQADPKKAYQGIKFLVGLANK